MSPACQLHHATAKDPLSRMTTTHQHFMSLCIQATTYACHQATLQPLGGWAIQFDGGGIALRFIGRIQATPITSIIIEVRDRPPAVFNRRTLSRAPSSCRRINYNVCRCNHAMFLLLFTAKMQLQCTHHTIPHVGDDIIGLYVWL